MFVRLSIRLSGTGMHRDHAVHFSADLNLWLNSPIFWEYHVHDTKTCQPRARCNARPVATGLVICVCDWLRDETGLDFGDRSWICNATLVPVVFFQLHLEERLDIHAQIIRPCANYR